MPAYAGHDTLGIRMPFTLAHLSDPHLAPLPRPRLSELIGKRITGYLNWQLRRRFIHDRARARRAGR